MTTLPLAEARAQVSKLVDQAASTHEHQDLLRDHLRGLDALDAGNSLGAGERAEVMRVSGCTQPAG